MKRTVLPLTLALCIASVVKAEVLSLTAENFDSETAGKNIFIKFFAPWSVRDDMLFECLMLIIDFYPHEMLSSLLLLSGVGTAR